VALNAPMPRLNSDLDNGCCAASNPEKLQRYAGTSLFISSRRGEANSFIIQMRLYFPVEKLSDRGRILC